MSEDKNKDKNSKTPAIWAGVFALFVIISFCLAFKLWPPFSYIPEENKFTPAQDSLTALYTGLALVFVCWTAFMQREELNKTSQALKDQAETMELQRIESTLISLMKALDEKIKLTESYKYISKNKNELFGFDALTNQIRENELYDLFVNSVFSSLDKPIVLPRSITNEELKKLENFFQVHYDKVYPFFNLLLNMLEYIDVSEKISKDKKQFWADIIFTSLPLSAQFVLYYFSMTNHGVKLRKYFKRYNFRSNLTFSRLDHDLFDSLSEE